jgi:hypothetical protein
MTRSITLHCYLAQKLVTETVNRPPPVHCLKAAKDNHLAAFFFGKSSAYIAMMYRERL